MSLRESDFSSDSFLNACIPGDSYEIKKLKDYILRLNTQLSEVKSILILGETGVGKTHLAQIIVMHRYYCQGASKIPKYDNEDKEIQYDLYARSGLSAPILSDYGNPYAEINIASYPEPTIARSELFGHVKGAFTGAVSDKVGFLGNPKISDVLIDEIGYASSDLQRGLLQVIQSGKFYKMGSEKQLTSNSRLIFATNQDLQDLVKKERFQIDLLWRLMNHVIEIQPLRQNREEIRNFIDNYVGQYNKFVFPHDKEQISYIYPTPDDYRWAVDEYEWPGNKRELEQTLRRWFLYRQKLSLKEAWAEVERYLPSKREVNSISKIPLSDKTNSVDTQFSGKNEVSVLREYYIYALKECDGKKIDAAKMVGLKYKTFCSRLTKLKIGKVHS